LPPVVFAVKVVEEPAQISFALAVTVPDAGPATDIVTVLVDEHPASLVAVSV